MSRFLAIWLPLLVAYAGSLLWIWESWFLPESYWSHGPLMPLLAVFLVWQRRPLWSGTQVKPCPAAWWLLAPGLVLHLAGAALTIDSLSAASLVLTLPAATLLTLGSARFGTLASVVFLTALTVPLPQFVTGAIAFEMKEVATDQGIALAQLFGSEVTRQAATIRVPGQEEVLVVADACSGLRSLVSLVTLGYCVAFFLGTQRGPRRWVLLSLAGPVAVLSNVVRIAVICWLAEGVDVSFASGLGHDLVNGGVWLLDLGVLLALDAWLSRKSAEDLA